MKRYLLFGYDQYYPGGGQGDMIGDYNTIEEIREYMKGRSQSTQFDHDFYDVLDMEERRWLEDEEFSINI